MTHQLGWECPKCHSVYAPWVYKCTTCPCPALTTFSYVGCTCGYPGGTLPCPVHVGTTTVKGGGAAG